MRIERIEVGNFMALRHAVIEPSPGLTVLAAGNAAGKTAMLEAITFALDQTYKPRGRTTIKSLDDLITLGASAGFAEVVTSDGVFRRQLKGGKHSTNPPSRVEHLDLLISADLATLKPSEVRDRVLSILGGKTGPADIVNRLIRRGCDATKARELEVLLKGGTFDPALKRVAASKSEERGKWQATTGTAFGTKKALGDGTGWRPEGADQLPPADEVRARIAALQEEEKELDLATRFGGGISGPCPCCGEQLTHYKGAFVAEKSLPPRAEGKPDELMRQLNDLRQRIQNNEGRLQLIESGEDIAAKAFAIYQEYCQWQQLEDALQPDGVPGELWSSATKRLDKALIDAAADTGVQVSLGPDGEPRLGPIPYGLLSESQQWRVNAILRICLAELSGIGVACVDRFDVIEPAERGALMQWIVKKAQAGVQVILAGTFKQAPSVPGATVCWIEGGTAEQRDAA